jgi:2-polyprenyl-3-methyl-5-hydroxy-6-metoxy-1,4-benzoquinol methylase
MHRNLVAEHYDAVAAGYHKQYQRENLHDSEEYPANYFRLQTLVTRLAASRVKRVFEVGVGEGTPLVAMAEMGFEVAGCDVSQAMVARARERFESAGLSPDLIEWGDIEDSTTVAGRLKDGPFDAVIAAGVLPHVASDELFLENVKMLLRPGGKVLIEFRNKLFSLFTFNRYTKEFILDDLLAGAPAEIRRVVERDLDRRLALDLPPVRAEAPGAAPGYDLIPARFHNPFTLLETFERAGFTRLRLHWYHYHPAPPMHERTLGSVYREAAMSLEHETSSWRGYFLCSAGVVEGDLA